MQKGDFVKLKCDNEARPSKFMIRAFRNDALERRVSCRLIRQSGKGGGLYLFRLSEIESYAECVNPYCLDGWVDHEEGTQDGRESYVNQVPCEICRIHTRQGGI